MELIKETYKEFNTIRDIYDEAFPKRERKPISMQKHKIKVGDYELLVLYDGNKIVGFATTCILNNIVMLDYLAISSKVRSNGAGSILLNKVVDYYQGKTVFLMCESLDNKADNNDQRIRRKKFYHKNGFYENGIVSNGSSGRMDVMLRSGNITPDEYEEMQKFALGKILFKLSRIGVESFTPIGRPENQD